jgi:hypothetical protein
MGEVAGTAVRVGMAAVDGIAVLVGVGGMAVLVGMVVVGTVLGGAEGMVGIGEEDTGGEVSLLVIPQLLPIDVKQFRYAIIIQATAGSSVDVIRNNEL